jgi:hypothetical protein
VNLAPHPHTGPVPPELMFGYGYRPEWPEIVIPGRGSFRAPPAVASLPRDERGYPVAYSFWRKVDKRGVAVKTASGAVAEASFTMIDPVRVRACGENALCGVCGFDLSKAEGHDFEDGPQRLYFIGGPQSCERTWTFNDPPMHFACAMFSMRVCPWMVLARYRRLPQQGVSHEAGINIPALDGDERPPKIGLVSAPRAEFDGPNLLWYAARFPKLLGYVAPHGWPTDEQMKEYWRKSERAKMLPEAMQKFRAFTLFQHRMGLMLDRGHFIVTGRVRWIPNPRFNYNPVTVLGDGPDGGVDADVAQANDERTYDV